MLEDRQLEDTSNGWPGIELVDPLNADPSLPSGLMSLLSVKICQQVGAVYKSMLQAPCIATSAWRPRQCRHLKYRLQLHRHPGLCS